MKIYTITCQHVYNYGATLQAYALQKYLEEKGHCVNIIQFVPEYYSYDYKTLNKGSRSAKLAERFPVLKPLLILRKYVKYKRMKGRQNGFDEFDRNFLKLTEHAYKSSEDLKMHPPKGELYIAGSDQIWNINMPNGHEDAFFLDFGDKGVYRASYAASFGISSIDNPQEESRVRSKVSKIDCISVREKTGKNILSGMGINDVKCVSDPVYLLDNVHWGEIASKANRYELPAQYILFYNFKDEPRIRSFAKLVSKQTGLPLVSLNDYDTVGYASVNINDAGPCEFLELIRNATLVISNSFHATSFSIIFKKEFYVFPLAGGHNSSRMVDLLDDLGCIDRFNPNQYTGKKLDYDMIMKRLQNKITDSKTFLDTVLAKAQERASSF